MSRSKLYVINIPPIPWKRAQLNGKHFFDGQAKDKVIFGLSMNKQHAGEPPFNIPIEFMVNFFMPLPRTAFQGKDGKPCVGKCDLDNLVKFLLDTAVDVQIITNDNIVCVLKARKLYSKLPRVEFQITEL